MFSVSGTVSQRYGRIAIIMCGAVYNHLVHDPIAQAAPALMLGTLVVTAGLLRRRQALFLSPPAA